MELEINIVEIVKSRRYIHKALNMLIPEEKRLELKQMSEIIKIDPSDDNEEGHQLEEPSSPLDHFEKDQEMSLITNTKPATKWVSKNKVVPQLAAVEQEEETTTQMLFNNSETI